MKAQPICSFKPSPRWNWMPKFFLVILFPLSLAADTFKISIYTFPRNLQPQLQSSAVSYLFQNIFRNLYLYDGKKGLVLDFAEKCGRNPENTVLKCKLKKNLKWSNGDAIVAQDFVDTYKRILDPKNKYIRPDLLFTVKNAKEIYLGTKKPDELGVKAVSPREIQFDFEKPDSEFEYNLANFYLSPTKGDYEIKDGRQYLTNGPYKLKSWNAGKNLTLESNAYYPGHPRPLVEFLIIDEDTVSLRLYEKGEMSIVRRLPTLLIPKYRDRKDFVSLAALRFDYLGMGPELKNDPLTRKILATSLNYPEWQNLLFSKGRPGCIEFPPAWGHFKKCFDFQKGQSSASKKNLKFYYSLQGGDDNRRTAEWLQSQWKKNAGIDFQVRGIENKTFLSELKNSPPGVFRKGLAPDRPTCSGILENFTSDHPENYIQNRSPEFNKVIEELRQSSDKKTKTKLCKKAFHTLLNQYLIIPTGSYDYSMLVSPKFTGWKLNELNQLDLSHLKNKDE
jgi:oligopeptide transport system substrate-binding protein